MHDVGELFGVQVIETFVSEYRAARTPNPCLACNSSVRFPELIRLADQQDCSLVATGHYARTSSDGKKGFGVVVAKVPVEALWKAINDEDLHDHGSSSIRYGRGAVLTIDLTNRCNMMCDPCFMDANQVGFVHELQWEDIQKLLDDAATIKPRRQLSVQFSGGEPTLSPHFLDAVRYATKVGYKSIQAATNGIEFARSKEFCKQAADAGADSVLGRLDYIGVVQGAWRYSDPGRLLASAVGSPAPDGLGAWIRLA